MADLLLLTTSQEKPHLTRHGYQILVLDYADRNTLQYALTGIDVVISVVPSEIQTNFIDAAIMAGVRRFVPAEYEGMPGLRTASGPLDRHRSHVLAYLRLRSDQIEYTSFVCGIFYERFAPGGLARFNIGIRSGIPNEGDYMVNIRSMIAEVPVTLDGHVFLRMTAAADVAKYIVKSLDIVDRWPEEMTMCGERRTCIQLLEAVALVRGTYRLLITSFRLH